MKRVTHSNRATPIVTPAKKDGNVRTCGDFKVTVNLQLDVDSCPIPGIGDIFTGLAGSKQFSVIDL